MGGGLGVVEALGMALGVRGVHRYTSRTVPTELWSASMASS